MIFIDRISEGNQCINLTVGDDAAIEISMVDDDGNAYAMESNDYLIFTVREKASFDSPIMFEIQSLRGINEITFSHDDTKDFEPGYYSAEIQLMTGNGKRITIWPKQTGAGKTSKDNRRNFCLMSEVVYQ